MERTLRVRNESSKNLILVFGSSPLLISSGETFVFKVNANTGVAKKETILRLIDPETNIEIGEPYSIRSTANYYLIRDNWERRGTVYITGMFFAY